MKDRYQWETDYVERARIIGPYEEGKELLQWLHDNGYRVTRSGPYTDREMHPKCDATRFLFTAERECESGSLTLARAQRQETPNAPGFYWLRECSSNSRPRIVEIYEHEVWRIGSDVGESLEEIEGEWYGPLLPPEVER